MITVEMLKKAGFVETFYLEQGETRPFWTKKTLAMHLPYINEHVVDGEYVCAEDTAVIEVTPSSTVQIVIGDNYMEQGIAIESEEGLTMLKDAGVVLK